MAAGLLLAHAAGALAAGRETRMFDFGWRFRTGLTAKDPPNSEPPTNPDPGLTPPESKPAYNHNDWEQVNLPHDGLIAQQALYNGTKTPCADGCSGRSFLPRHVLWYRKQFTIPANWSGSSYWLDFQGAFRNATTWVNGDLVSSHVCGYTPFRIRLDNVTSVVPGQQATVALFIDPDNGPEGSRDHGSGWWYEGGGLYRSVTLVRTERVHIDQDSLFAKSSVFNTDANLTGVVTVQTEVGLVNDDAAAADACVDVEVFGPDGTAAAPKASGTISVGSSGVSTVAINVNVTNPKLWSSSSPTLYTVTATVYSGKACSGVVADTLSVVHGFRALKFDANEGMFLNNAHFKVRGFCDHNNFAVVGMAVPPRVNLFRAQASRAVGGNGRRTSHNPPNMDMLDIYDRIGIVVMDENRLFENKTSYVDNMHVLVKRDRNHPSVVVWSFCNEGGCEGSREQGGPRFQATTDKYDGTRPTLANMFTYNDLLSNTIDIQGFSHQSRDKLEKCHEALPKKPIFGSECCSCNTMRDEDEGVETTHDNPHTDDVEKSFNARCAESNSATNASDGVPYAVGTMVWTLFDYYGEPPKAGYEVSSTYGQYDLCGFPKAAAFWYRTQWLLTRPDGPDKTFLTHGKHEVHLVESWESPDAFPSTKGQKTRNIHAYSSAPKIELLVNGKSQGERAVVPMSQGPGSYAEWLNVVWEAGELTAVAKYANGTTAATVSRYTNGKAAKLVLGLDAPSVSTGTGTAVVLDGQDAALVRASIVDADGRVMHQATNNVTFKVVSGPGMVQGTGNGDPRNHDPNNMPWHPAYHGLVRAVVRVTSVAAHADRVALSEIDAEGLMTVATEEADPQPIVVEASSPGFAPAQITIPTSTDLVKDGVYAAAAAAAGQPVDFFAH